MGGNEAAPVSFLVHITGFGDGVVLNEAFGFDLKLHPNELL